MLFDQFVVALVLGPKLHSYMGRLEIRQAPLPRILFTVYSYLQGVCLCLFYTSLLRILGDVKGTLMSR